MKMKHFFHTFSIASAIAVVSSSVVFAEKKEQALPADPDGFLSIFDGKSLNHWDGNPEFWRVEEGTITGQTTAEKPTKGNTFIQWTAGELDDFELKLEYKIIGGNSGIQYRSFEVPGEKWVIGGYQADFEAGDTWSGLNYGERFRGILAKRGEKATVADDGKPVVTGSLGDPKELQQSIKKEDWNEYHIIAKGFTMQHYINGKLMSELVDEDMDTRRRGGVLALQLHAGPPMKVQFRNIQLKRLPLGDKKKIALLAGNKSHGYGAHEHRAGCMLLAEQLNKHMGDKIHAVVYDSGWPTDPTVLQNADAIIMFCDGGGRHMARWHRNQIDYYAKKGIGIGCVHYGVEVPKDQGGAEFLNWIGGYFETDWSVNPHWEADFTQFPEHPVTRGVKPFSVNDEWYYHMRFRDDMKGVTPILSALPPESTLTRKDGPHSGNPHVRAAVLGRKEPQHVCWVSENEGGGRGFGFTGAHFHNNWANDSFRTVVLNAVTWIAKVDVPEGGVLSDSPDEAALEANQDFPKPGEKKKKNK